MTGEMCSCLRIDCSHARSQCPNPASPKGGICNDCRYYVPPKPCPTCGQPMPQEDE